MTSDANVIRADFTSPKLSFRNANIGLATGKVSGLFVVDVDTPEGHDVDGLESIRN